MTKSNKLTRLLIICILPLIVSIYAIWYWSSDYDQLTQWYKGLNPSFYRVATWNNTFFTENVKMQGNWWCFAALLSSFIWVLLVWRVPLPVKPKLILKRKSVIEYAILVIVGTGLSILVNRFVYAADEVFSAINFASIPSFQAVSYYVLPNNHLLFNFINGALFFWRNDLVLTGRIISLICYIAILCLSWNFLKKWISNNWLRWPAIFILAVQFSVWGFSGQSRGYELLLLCSILSIISFWNYWVERKPDFLILYSSANVAGILTMPSYMYWWVGLLMAALLFMIWERHADWIFIRASLASAACSMIFLLPLLSFSGLAAITNNSYVQPESVTTIYFLTHINEQHYFNGLFYEWFSFNTPFILIGVAIILLPMLSFFYPQNNRRYRSMGILCLSMLVAFLFMLIVMKRLPFYRNLIAHGYLALMFLIIAIIPLFRTKMMRFGFVVLLMIGIAFSAVNNYKRMPDSLYYYGVNDMFSRLSESKTIFRPESTVFLDDECFYWWYVLKVKYPEQTPRIAYNRTSFDNQDYCIMPVDSLLPAGSVRYRLIECCFDFNIYKRTK